MSKLERERERDSWKANLRSELSETPAETMNTDKTGYAHLVCEIDQLRKVADEWASTIYVHSLRPQNALDGYNQLPHVQARNTPTT